jgi:2-polyprenyl-6-methoxyphenol hydroxylase-like FAD-dependent oxidoreductase
MISYDVIIIGGGIAGAALAKVLAENTVKTLVIEGEPAFRDRVRGEGMHPWGVAEAKLLGIYDLLKHTCGHEVQWWNNYTNSPEPVARRDLFATTPHGAGSLNFYHPEMQEVLLTAAQTAGAEVWRGARATHVIPGETPRATILRHREPCTLSARLIVCADGRNSTHRVSAGFQVQRDPERLVIAGVLLEHMSAPDDAVHVFYSAHSPEQFAIIFPLGRQRYRVYFIYTTQGRLRQLSGARNLPMFLTECTTAGVPQDWFHGSVAIGPLAMFQGADSWVHAPYRQGVVLIGDAAAASDPSFGCGLSLTLRDVRVLRDQLLAEHNWELAAADYARQHDDYYAQLHRKEAWLTQLLFELGPVADQCRAHAFALRAKEPARNVDIVGLGPDERNDETARRLFFGEDVPMSPLNA